MTVSVLVPLPKAMLNYAWARFKDFFRRILVEKNIFSKLFIKIRHQPHNYLRKNRQRSQQIEIFTNSRKNSKRRPLRRVTL